MTGPIGEDLAEYYFSAPAGVASLITIEIRHPAFDQPARLVNDFKALQATLEDDAPADAGQTVIFQSCIFDAIPPDSTDQGLPQAILTVENVTKILMPYIKAAMGIAAPIEFSIREYLPDDLSAPQQVIHGLTATGITPDIQRTTIKAGFEDVLNRPVPFRLYTSTEYPTLVR
jgi:hypothetical protein